MVKVSFNGSELHVSCAAWSVNRCWYLVSSVAFKVRNVWLWLLLLLACEKCLASVSDAVLFSVVSTMAFCCLLFFPLIAQVFFQISLDVALCVSVEQYCFHDSFLAILSVLFDIACRRLYINRSEACLVVLYLFSACFLFLMAVLQSVFHQGSLYFGGKPFVFGMESSAAWLMVSIRLL